jgi:SsrA-binding protein
MANRHRGPVEIPVVEKLAADYSIAKKPSEVVAAVAFTLNSRSPAETWKCHPPTPLLGPLSGCRCCQCRLWYLAIASMARQSAHQTRPNPEKNPRRDPTAAGQRDASVNRIAAHNYFLLEKFETGVVLTGTEVKSVRAGRANLKDAYGLIKDGELWLLNCHIGPYEHGNIFNHAPLRTRKLLVHAEELRRLIGKTQQKGLTLIPTRMYFKKGKVKVELALAKGKQLWDKRETERRKTAAKEARDAIARGRKGA